MMPVAPPGRRPDGRGGGIVYARSTTIHAQTSFIDAGIAHMRDELMPMIEGIQGCIGLSLIVARRTGLCIATTAWQSLEDMRASEEQLRPRRMRAAEIFGGSPQVEEWEIAVLHRDHRSRDGACVRAVWLQVEPAEAEQAIEIYKSSTLNALESLEGFCSASLLVDRTSGRAVSSVTYDSLEAMERNREQARRLREERAQEARTQVLDVSEFELAIAHLRVPELV